MRNKIASTLSRLTTILTLPFTFVCNHFESGLGVYRNSFITRFPQAPGALVQKLDDLFRDKSIALAFYTGDKKKLLEKGFLFFTTAWSSIIVEHPSLEGWVLKAGSCTKWFTARGSLFSRVYETNRVKEIIKHDGYSSLEVPATFLYHMRDFDSMKEESYVVIAQKITRSTDTDLSNILPSSKNEIYALVEKVGVWDAFGDNILITPQQKAFFVDLETLIALDTWWWGIFENLLLRKVKGKIGITLLDHALKRTHLKTQES